ncbi:hypothetical protein [Sphingobium sp. Leaf26]|uniref:hypothetical protein n=1 Tax=Sphingobium sp. Leaf26 TaxID=1735693 RepID=UPI001F3470FC|nr:hypothetical protein [Sphingobium sp. Leaf26]
MADVAGGTRRIEKVLMYMPKPTSLSLTFDCWSLGLEACSVIGMRLPRLMTGNAAALAEAQLMVSEKMEAVATLQWKMMTGGLGTSGPAMLDASLAHYRKAVRKNKHRLA